MADEQLFQCPESPLYDNHRAGEVEQCDGQWVPGAVGGRVGWQRNARERGRGAEVVVDGWDWAEKWRVCGGEWNEVLERRGSELLGRI